MRKTENRNLVPCKYHIKYPANAERDYIRLTNAIMKLLKEVIEGNAGRLKAAVGDGTRYDSAKDNEKERKAMRMTSFSRTSQNIEAVFEQMKKELGIKLGFFDAAKALTEISQRTQKLSISEFKRACRETIGIDLRDDYFMGELYDLYMRSWVSDNVELIKTIPYNALDDMKQMVFKSYVGGSTTTSILKEIQERYGMSKRHARFIARDQIGKLNGQITKRQQEQAGVSSYTWDDSGDSRVRKRHKALNGHVFSWDNSHPATNDKGEVITPGSDYQCRCCALPVFDLEEFPAEAMQLKNEVKGDITHDVPADMTFKDWKKTFVDGDKADIQESTPKTSESVQERIKKIDIENNDIKTSNAVATDAIKNGYEYRRTQKGISRVPFDELEGKSIIKADFTGMDERLADASAKQFAKLAKEYDTVCEGITVGNLEAVGAPAGTSYAAKIQSAEITFNKTIVKDYDKFRERMQKAVENNQFPKMNADQYDNYVVTHEFAHTLMDIKSPLKNYVNADTSHIVKARKEIKAIQQAYVEDLRESELKFRAAEKKALETFNPSDWENAQRLEADIDAKKISKYADMSVDEFMAEAFTDAKIGSNPSEYSKKVEKVIDKYFKKTPLEDVGKSGTMKLQINLFDDNDELYLEAFSIEEIPGFEDVCMHGSPSSVQKIIDGKLTNMDASEFAKYLKENTDYGGGDIRLASCETGKGDNSFAQQLSKELGVRIMAPDDDVYYLPDEGIVFVGSPHSNTGKWRIFNNGVEE